MSRRGEQDPGMRDQRVLRASTWALPVRLACGKADIALGTASCSAAYENLALDGGIALFLPVFIASHRGRSSGLARCGIQDAFSEKDGWRVSVGWPRATAQG